MEQVGHFFHKYAKVSFTKCFLSKKFYHIGPPRDFDLFYLFEKNKCEDINESEYLLCTGLFDDHDKDLKFYKDLVLVTTSHFLYVDTIPSSFI